MPDDSYENFDLKIERNDKNGYRLIASKPDGRSIKEEEFKCTFSDEELDKFQKIVGDFLESARGKRGSEDGSQEEESDTIDILEMRNAIKTYGDRFYKMIFKDEIEASLWQVYDSCINNRKDLRIRICLDEVPELSRLPWEYIYTPPRMTYKPAPLACIPQAHVVRFIGSESILQPITIKPPDIPLNILVMISANPPGYQSIDADREWENIKEIFRNLTDTKYVFLDKVDKPTRIELKRKIAQKDKEWHIFHYIGHGDIDESGEPLLILQSNDGNYADKINKEDLGSILNIRTLRMVVLNSCKGAQSIKSRPLSSLAWSLLQYGFIQVVVAMQSDISDDAAKLFSQIFYDQIANGATAERAVSEARKSILIASPPNPTEWGIPVLFVRSDRGLVFEIKQPDKVEIQLSNIQKLKEETERNMKLGRYEKAIQNLVEIINISIDEELAEEDQILEAQINKLAAEANTAIAKRDYEGAIQNLVRIINEKIDKDVPKRDQSLKTQINRLTLAAEMAIVHRDYESALQNLDELMRK